MQEVPVNQWFACFVLMLALSILKDCAFGKARWPVVS